MATRRLGEIANVSQDTLAQTIGGTKPALVFGVPPGSQLYPSSTAAGEWALFIESSEDVLPLIGVSVGIQECSYANDSDYVRTKKMSDKITLTPGTLPARQGLVSLHHSVPPGCYAIHVWAKAGGLTTEYLNLGPPPDYKCAYEIRDSAYKLVELVS